MSGQLPRKSASGAEAPPGYSELVDITVGIDRYWMCDDDDSQLTDLMQKLIRAGDGLRQLVREPPKDIRSWMKKLDRWDELVRPLSIPGWVNSQYCRLWVFRIAMVASMRAHGIEALQIEPEHTMEAAGVQNVSVNRGGF